MEGARGELARHLVEEEVGEPYTCSHAAFTTRSLRHLDLDLRRLAGSGIPATVCQEQICPGVFG